MENRDVAVYAQKGENLRGRTRTEYFLAIESAKHVAMMSGTENGFEVREYFLECERQAKRAALPDFTDPVIAARAWADEREAKKAAELQCENQRRHRLAAEESNAVLQPKAAAHDRIAESHGA